jgi:chromate transporter
MTEPRPLRQLAALYLRLGFTAFGGPAAHVAMLEEATVRRLGWLSHAEFLDLLGACNLLPGPSSTQLAMAVARRRAGWPGLLLGGLCFILPAAALTLALAWAYVRYGSLPQAAGFLVGLKPVAVAVVLQALWKLWPSALKDVRTKAVAALALAASLAGLPPLLVLLGCGALLWAASSTPRTTLPVGWLPWGGAAAPLPPSLGAVFLAFLKLGATVFGGGYVLLAFLQTDLVEHWHWLTQSQLLDAVAAGQVTPGPVFSTATFIGYILLGVPGAALATLGLFLPSFAMVGLMGTWVETLRRSPRAGAFLDGVNAAALALMAAACWGLGQAAVVNLWTGLLGLAAGMALWRWRINPVWLLILGAIAGFLLG